MTATVIQASRDTSDQSTETRRVRDVSKMLAYLEPDVAPLVTFMSRLRKKGATDPKIEWFEDEALPRFDTLGASLSSGASTMTVNNFTRFRKDDLVLVNHLEVVLVTTTPTTTSVAIDRAFGDQSAVSASSGQQLRILSPAAEEGATRRDLLSTQKVPRHNFLQIFRDPYGITKTAKATKTFAGKDWDNLQREQLTEHKKSMEVAMLLGQRKEITSGTHPQRATRGISTHITTNVLNVAGDLSENVFDNFLRTGYRYGKKTKVAFCSPIVMQAINGFAKDKLRTMVGKKTYGVTLTRYENAGRIVLLHEHIAMTNDGLNDFDGIAGEAFVIDIADITMRYMNGRLTVHRTNIQDNSADSREDEHLTEAGLEAKRERWHSKLQGVTG